MKEEKLAELRKKVFEAYMQKTPKSKQLYERASKSLLGGVSGGGRGYEPYPLYMTHGRGSKTYDVDGNEYIDCRASAGPLLLGHCHPEIMETVKREIDRGLLLTNVDLMVECAELLKELVPCAEKVRFINTGTEAVLSAVRMARGYTGKNKIIKFYGHYHGQDDQFLVATSNMKHEPTSAGVPPEHQINTVLLEYNDIDVVRRKLDEDNDIAAVLLDPQMNMGGIWMPSAEYLKELRRLTKERGVVLIFDEVITGFRMALGGAQEYFGVLPDLAVYAKGMAGGGKLAAIAGSEEVMGVTGGGPLAREKKVFQSGTYNDCTEGLAAGIAAMKVLKKLNEKGEYQRFSQRCIRLKSGIEAAFGERGMGCHVSNGMGFLRLWLTDLEPSFDAYCKLEQPMLYPFLLSLNPEGVFIFPSIANFIISLVHTDEDIEGIIGAVSSSLDKYNFKEVY